MGGVGGGWEGLLLKGREEGEGRKGREGEEGGACPPNCTSNDAPV